MGNLKNDLVVPLPLRGRLLFSMFPVLRWVTLASLLVFAHSGCQSSREMSMEEEPGPPMRIAEPVPPTAAELVVEVEEFLCSLREGMEEKIEGAMQELEVEGPGSMRGPLEERRILEELETELSKSLRALREGEKPYRETDTSSLVSSGEISLTSFVGNIVLLAPREIQMCSEVTIAPGTSRYIPYVIPSGWRCVNSQVHVVREIPELPDPDYRVDPLSVAFSFRGRVHQGLLLLHVDIPFKHQKRGGMVWLQGRVCDYIFEAQVGGTLRAAVSSERYSTRSYVASKGYVNCFNPQRYRLSLDG